MSAYIFGRVLYHPEITTAQKITLAAIADVVNDHGFGWMLISTLCLKTSLSERGVQKALGELIELGLLKRRVRRDRCSQFLIVVDALPLKPKLDDREADLPDGWGASGAPRGGAHGAGGGAPGAGGGAHGAPITLTEPGYETESPLSFGKEPPSSETDLFGETVHGPDQEAAHRRSVLIDTVGSSWKALSEANALIPMFRKMDDARRAAIIKRAEQHADGDDLAKVWETIFAEIAGSRFLRGLSAPGKDRDAPFSVKFDWLLKPANFKKVIEGNFRDQTGDNEHFDPATGRKLSAHDVAKNRINERLQRSQQRAAARENPGSAPTGRIGYSSPTGR